MLFIIAPGPDVNDVAFLIKFNIKHYGTATHITIFDILRITGGTVDGGGKGFTTVRA